MKSQRRRIPLWIWVVLITVLVFIVVVRLGTSAISGEGGFSFGEKVGIIRLIGPIIGSEQVIHEFNTLKDRSDVKAIVFRINSPGGTVAPSQEIYEKVKNINMQIPIVVSVGNLAASGGYYAAMGSNTIVVNRGSIVGSIGVILDYPVATDLLDKLGLRFETLTSGEYKDSGSPTRQVTEKDREYFQYVIDDLHNQFVSAVSLGRNLELDEVGNLADGRIFTGEQAIALGLADTLGTLEDAIKIAGKLAGIQGKPRTIQLRRKSSTFLDFMINTVMQRYGNWRFQQPAYRWK
ncbi:MAG: signal peptide peptidase SppA [Candidatus Neomarinimicrobiota bacterium]